jgi:hypothetical protein
MDKTAFTLEGSGILLMHSDAGVDDRSDVSRQIKAITDKKKKDRTDDDQELHDRLYWERAMYFDKKIGPFIPAWNVKAMIQKAAGLRRKGKTVERGLVLAAESFALSYDGPRKLDAMWKAGRFTDSRSIKNAGPSGGRVMRVRPRFEGWKLECDFFLDPTEIDERDLREYIEYAGHFIGLGDYRKRYGKFTVGYDEERAAA